MNTKEQVMGLKEELISLRRDFHIYPELGFQEYKTQEKIIKYLKGCGLEPEKIAKTGVVALLEGDQSGPTLLMRTDMDALPIEEENELSFKSLNPGVMHACGHDGHMAMMLVAAKILSANRDKLKGNIKFVFQPNEEDAGAYLMIEEGILENPKVDAAVGIHLWSPIETGRMGISQGPIMASSEYFNIKIKGKGGHGGAPHESTDPIICASNIIQEVQSIQSRRIDVINQPTVISFGSIQGGDFPIIIPERAELAGSIRCLHGDLDYIKEEFERKIRCQCESDQTTYELAYKCGNNLLSNNPDITNLVRKNAIELIGEENIESNIAVMLGEDFSDFSSRVPSCFYFVGVGNREKETDYYHHHPRFNIDEDALSLGVEMHVRTALAYLNK